MAREEDPWLVKSSGRILGPFPSGKIIELLRSREASVLDEISSPMRRWQTIQYHPEFKDTVANLRRANVSDKTEATWTPSGNTMTSNLTQTLSDAGGGELTEELEDIDGFSAGPTQEIVVHDVQEQVSTAVPAAGGRFQVQHAQNTAIQRQVEKTTRGLWIVTVLILLAVAAFIVQRRMAHGGFDSKISPSTLKQTVLAHVQTGQFADALRELKAYYADPMQAGELAIYYGSLLIQVEGQTVVGRRILNGFIAAHRPELKQAYTSLGIADLIEGQVDAAQENFDKALAIDPGFPPAIVNSSAVAMQRGDYPKAKALAQKALQYQPNMAEGLLALAEAQLYLFKSNSNVNDLSAVSKVIKDFRLKQWDYASELGFYSLYFDFLRQDHAFEERLREYLDQDPQLTTDHRHNVFIYKAHSQWKVLGRLCELAAGRMGESPRVAALIASCFSHEQRWEEARRYIDKAVQQAPKDALIQGWYYYVLRESNEGDLASMVLGHANEFNRKGEFVLPIIMQARFCSTPSREDIDCTRDSWQRIYEHDLDFLPAINGLAWVYSRKGSRTEAIKFLERGLKISPDYIPLLLLRQKAEKEGWYASN